MEPIYPLTVDGCTPHIGRTICAVMHNGFYYVGTLSNVTPEGIYVGGGFQGPGVLSTHNVKKVQKEINENLQKATTTAFFNPFFFPFASLAFLFAFPFFFSPFFI